MKRLLLFFVLIFVVSCSQQKTETIKERFFWPPPPDEPKIEFIGVYHTSKQFDKLSVLKAIVGDTEPEIKLRKPLGIASDGEGLVVVTDYIPQGAVAWDFNQEKVGFLTKEKSSLTLGAGVEFDSKRIYIADAVAGNVKVFSRKNKEPLYVIGDKEEIPSPVGVAVNEKLNRLYVLDVKAGKIVVYDTETKKTLFSFGKPGDKEGEFNRAWSLCIDKNGDVIVGDGLNARVQIFNQDGKFLSMFGKRGDKAGSFSQVKGIGIDSDGNIYTVDPMKAVQVFNRKGELLGLVGGSGNKGIGAMLLPMGLYVDKKDRIYVTDQMNRRFYVFQYMNEEYKKAHPVEKKN